MPPSLYAGTGLLSDQSIAAIKRILREMDVPAAEILAATQKDDLLQLCNSNGVGPFVPDEWTIDNIKRARKQKTKSIETIMDQTRPGAKMYRTHRSKAAITPVAAWQQREEARKQGERKGGKRRAPIDAPSAAPVDEEVMVSAAPEERYEEVEIEAVEEEDKDKAAAKSALLARLRKSSSEYHDTTTAAPASAAKQGGGGESSSFTSQAKGGSSSSGGSGGADAGASAGAPKPQLSSPSSGHTPPPARRAKTIDEELAEVLGMEVAPPPPPPPAAAVVRVEASPKSKGRGGREYLAMAGPRSAASWEEDEGEEEDGDVLPAIDGLDFTTERGELAQTLREVVPDGPSLEDLRQAIAAGRDRPMTTPRGQAKGNGKRRHGTHHA